MPRKAINEVGNKYGKWTVLKRVENAKCGEIRWSCLCECGNVHKVQGKSLRRGHSTQCRACMGRARKGKKDQAAFSRLYARYKYKATKRKRQWNLTKTVFRTLTKMNCYYCGSPPAQIQKPDRKQEHVGDDYVYTGIDRVDNTRGYEQDNVLPCCGKCNFGKHNLTSQEYIEHCKAVAKHNEIPRLFSA